MSVLRGLTSRGLVVALACISAGARADAVPASYVSSNVAASFANLAVPFEANAGDDDPRVAFRARTMTGTLFVTGDGRLVHSLRARNESRRDAAAGRRIDPTPRRDWVLTETMVGARVAPVGGLASATRVSRFVGADAAGWRSDVPTFERVSLGEAWPGITVELAARARGIEKLFVVAPAADVRRIRVQLGGARRLALDDEGGLVAHTGNGPVRFTAPIAWQDVRGERRPVRVSYKLAGNRYGFVLGSHDPALPLVIDPLLEATYLGGIAGDVAYAMAVDASGAVYVAGSTGSTNFPGTAAGAQAVAAGGGDAFVAKLSHDLTLLVQATYLGGSGTDLAQALALDASGAVFVAGSTNSTNFAGTSGGAQPSPGGSGDAFVAKLNADLTKLSQATYLGGSGFDQAFGLTVSASGDVFVAGSTASTNFPATAGGAQSVRGGAGDAFVAKLSNDLATLLQATYLGGSGTDVAYAIAQAANGVVYIAGSTISTNFPGTSGAAQANAGGGGDAFVAQLDERLTTLMQSTYLGGSAADIAYAVALDPGDAVVVAGDTASANFPGTSRGAQPNKSGGDDAFVARLDSSLTILTGATYLGGLSDDLANGLAIDGAGTIFVVGNTRSTNFPGTTGGAQANPGGNGDAFAARLDNALSTVIQATYFGGGGLDQGLAVAVDARGNVYVAGGTASTNLPGTAGAAQPTAGGGGDAFIGRLTASLRLVDPPAIEYWHAEWNHYFVTASIDEIAKLDAGVFVGWTRTGQSFKVLPLDTAGTANVCRFFSVSFAPKSSHFYTPSASECAIVKQNPDWEFEAEVFAVFLPGSDGGCGNTTMPLYRLYNDGQGGAPNHRYTTSLATRDQMLAQGWIPEGAGPLGVIACVPA